MAIPTGFGSNFVCSSITKVPSLRDFSKCQGITLTQAPALVLIVELANFESSVGTILGYYKGMAIPTGFGSNFVCFSITKVPSLRDFSKCQGITLTQAPALVIIVALENFERSVGTILWYYKGMAVPPGFGSIVFLYSTIGTSLRDLTKYHYIKLTAAATLVLIIELESLDSTVETLGFKSSVGTILW